MRNFIAGFVACYLMIAVFAGFAMKSVMPPLNLLGVAYVGLTTPVNLFCTAISDFKRNGPKPVCTLMPSPEDKWAEALFTFE